MRALYCKHCQRAASSSRCRDTPKELINVRCSRASLGITECSSVDADECGELRRGHIVLLAADRSVPLKIHERPFIAYRAFTPGDTIDKL